MQIAYHLGAHVTDEGRILDCLRANADRLADHGIALPGPGRFRAPLSEALQAHQAGASGEAVLGVLLDALTDRDDVERIVMSVDSFLCPARDVLDEDTLYPNADTRTQRLRELFDGHEVEFLLAIRNPATFLPALHQRIGSGSFKGLIANVDPITLRWSDVVARILAANPGVPLTVWCNEDTPLMWWSVLRAVGGHAPGLRLTGTEDFLAALMTGEGIRRMRAYMEAHPPRSDAQHGRVVSAFLDKFALPDEIEMDLGDTGWSESYVEALGELYDEDAARIAGMPGVRFLTP